MKNRPFRPTARPPRNFKDYVKFICIALIILFCVEYFIWDEGRPYVRKMKEAYYKEQAAEKKAMEALLPPAVIYPDDGGDYFEAPPEMSAGEKQSLIPDGGEGVKPLVTIKKKLLPELPKRPKKVTRDGKGGKIAIVIDDVGMNVKQSRAAINLPGAVTLAFLPYAVRVKSMAIQAQEKNHEIIIHAPMEAMNADVPLGEMALRSGMDFAGFNREFEKIAASFDGYVGVNNHMGSRLTQDQKAMGYLMDQLKSRDLYFLDSKTIHTSIAAQTAHQYGVPFAVRDVFLDHESTKDFVAKALRNTERIASTYGQAIAIGHPKEVTMAALKEWIPTLKAKGFELVPLSALMQTKTVMSNVNEMSANKIDGDSSTLSGIRNDSVDKPSFSAAVPVQLNLQLPYE